MNNEYIHVCFGLHDKDGKYSVNVAVVMHSIMQNTQGHIHFHILSDDSLSEENKLKFTKLIWGTDNLVEFHNIDANVLNMSGDFVHIYTIGALMRLLIPDVFAGFDKMIYLDADLLVNCDIQELWNIDISEVSIGAVHDRAAVVNDVGVCIVSPGYVKAEEYFNSGVLLMNLDKIRHRGNLVELVSAFVTEHPDSYWLDQDALNYIFKEDKKLLDPKWNVITGYERQENHQLRDVVYHFAGDHFVGLYYLTEYDKKLLYTRTVAWNDPDRFYMMMSVIDSLRTHITLNQKIMSLVSRRNTKCVFYGNLSDSMRNLINIVGIKYGDYFVLDDYEHNVCQIDNIPTKAFDELRSEIKGAFVVFVLPEADSGMAISKLESIGLLRDEEFFVVPCVMTSDQGGYLY